MKIKWITLWIDVHENSTLICPGFSIRNNSRTVMRNHWNFPRNTENMGIRKVTNFSQNRVLYLWFFFSMMTWLGKAEASSSFYYINEPHEIGRWLSQGLLHGFFSLFFFNYVSMYWVCLFLQLRRTCSLLNFSFPFPLFLFYVKNFLFLYGSFVESLVISWPCYLSIVSFVLIVFPRFSSSIMATCSFLRYIYSDAR